MTHSFFLVSSSTKESFAPLRLFNSRRSFSSRFVFKAEKMITFNKQRQRKNVCTGGLWARLWALLVLAYRLFERRLEEWKECTMLFAGRGTLKYYPDRRCTALCFHEQKSSFVQAQAKINSSKRQRIFCKIFSSSTSHGYLCQICNFVEMQIRIRFAC